MSSQAKSRTARPSSRLRAGVATAGVAVALLAVGACGSDDEPAPPAEPADGGIVDISGTEAVGEETAGSVAQLVECRDWNGATSEQKLATIEDVRSQVSRSDSGISGPELTDDEATELFDSSCEPTWAQGFRLYKLYARAAGFVTLKRELEAQP